MARGLPQIRLSVAAVAAFVIILPALTPVAWAEPAAVHYRTAQEADPQKSGAGSVPPIPLPRVDRRRAEARAASHAGSAGRRSEIPPQNVQETQDAADQSRTAISVRMDPGAFGSVAFPFGALPMADRWQRILAENSDRVFASGCSGSGHACKSELVRQLAATQKIAAGLPVAARLQVINSAVNSAIRYRSDRRSYGKTDHWATLAEIAERGAGDCEDYAIAKMWLLKASGIPSDAMQLIVLRDTRRSLYHAVLAVHHEGQVFILDNVRDGIGHDSDLSTYVPIYSLAWRGAWIHGFRSRSVAVAEGPLNAIHPGESAPEPVASLAAELRAAAPAAH